MTVTVSASLMSRSANFLTIGWYRRSPLESRSCTFFGIFTDTAILPPSAAPEQEAMVC